MEYYVCQYGLQRSLGGTVPYRRQRTAEGRPINPAQGRAAMLAALEAVDLVVVFEEDTPLELIERVHLACWCQRLA